MQAIWSQGQINSARVDHLSAELAVDSTEGRLDAPPIRRVKTLSLMPTWQCTAECESCGTFSSPKVTTHLPLSAILSAIEQAAELNYAVVVFTGGEPTLARDKLIAGIRLAASKGLVTRVVTNAHWATINGAAQRFNELVDAGLSEINFSTGDEHAKFVPIDNVARAMALAIERRLEMCTMIEIHQTRTITREALLKHPLIVDIAAKHPERPIRITESPWMPMSVVPRRYPDGMTSNRSNLAHFRGCDSILTTTTVEADGSIRSCCGLGMRQIPELKIGSIDSTSIRSATEVAEDDILKRWIKIQGPEHILAWAASKDPGIEWENYYSHQCQACLRIYKDEAVRSVIRKHHGEKIADIVFSEWLHSGGIMPQPTEGSDTPAG